MAQHNQMPSENCGEISVTNAIHGHKANCPYVPDISALKPMCIPDPLHPKPRETGLASFLPSAFLPVILLALVFLALASSGCALRSGPSGGGSVSGMAITKTAMSAIGTKYTYGGATPNKGFDCSGLIAWSYNKNGLSVPRTAKEQSKFGISVSRKSLRPGDIVAFKISSGMHTGIYTGNGKFVHSPRTGKTVRVEDMNKDYWRKRYVAGRRHPKVY